MLSGSSRLVGGSHLSGDTRASEGFYTPLYEDFYRAYVDSGIAFRPQRVC
jgi:hypothetical protein